MEPFVLRSRSRSLSIIVACALASAMGAIGIVACSSTRFELGLSSALAEQAEGGSTSSAAFADAQLDAPLPRCPSNECPPFHADCNGDAGDGCEANLRIDMQNCGACGVRCEAADGGALPPYTRPACMDGKCVLLCLDDDILGPMRNCWGADPMQGDPVKGCPNQIACDPHNCGACGVNAPVDPTGDRICSRGNPLPECPAGTTNCRSGSCGAQCRNLDTDPQNCGQCWRRCPDSSIPPATVAALKAKHIGFTCGGPNPDGGLPPCVPVCESSTLPPALWKDCDGDFQQTVADPTNPAFNGCELDTFNNKDDCGSCGDACQIVCHTKPSSTTQEQICDCPPGLKWCGDECVDTNNDPHHCGSCAGQCLGPWDGGNGSPVCIDSQCTFKCNAGFGNCNAKLPDGCEADLQNSPDHCGDCATKCAKDQRCGSGACRLKDCDDGPLK